MSKVSFQSEKDLEDYICEHINKYGVCPISGEDVDFFKRQVRVGSYGIADVVKVNIDVDGGIYITVLELKNTELSIKDVSQALRYKTGITHYISETYGDDFNHAVNISCELAVTKYSHTDDMCFLHNYIDDFKIFEFHIDPEHGFDANEIKNGWRRKEAEFECVDNGFISRIKRKSICKSEAFAAESMKG